METASSELKVRALERSVSKQSLRIYMLIAVCLIGLFTFPDRELLPLVLHEPYLFNRFGIQIPAGLIFIALTFLPQFDRYRESVLLVMFVTITFSNYALILLCWSEAGFLFPYEGTLLYAFFAFFIMRIKLSYALLYFLFATAGFALLVVNFPIYGDRAYVNLGFVASSLLIGWVGVYALDRSFKAAKHANKTLLKLSRLDPLTGLYNRRAFEEKFSSLLSYAQRKNENVTVFMIDIDHFKLYNDTYGHQQGDRVIQIQANILRSVFKRKYDCVGRYGGEEFVAATNGINEQEALDLAQSILNQWKEKSMEQVFNEEKHYVSCSIGIFSSIPNTKGLNYLVDNADKALYQAKDNGRSCAVYISR